MNKRGNQQMLKGINKSLLLNLIYKHGPISRIELARLTKLSPTTVSSLVEEIIKEGIIHETGTTSSGVGRKMTLLNVHTDNGYVVGIELSKKSSLFVILNLRGEVIIKEKMESFIGEQAIRDNFANAIEKFIDQKKINSKLIKWIGVSIPGIIDAGQETVISSENLQIKDFPLKALLSETFDIPIHVVNDIEAAGFAERFSGAAKGKQTIVYILIDYGVGAGFVIDNQIYRGISGKAGKVSDFYYYSMEKLVEKLRAEYSEVFTDARPEAVIGKFIKLALDGEEPFKAEMDEILHHIAKYCGNVLQLLNPEQMILSGWIASNEEITNELAKLIHLYESSSGNPTTVKSSYWKEFGPSIGSATLGLHQMFKTKTFL